MHRTYFNKPECRPTFISLNQAKLFLIHKFKILQTGFTAVYSLLYEPSNRVLTTQCTYLFHVMKVALCVEMPRPTIWFISIPAAKVKDRCNTCLKASEVFYHSMEKESLNIIFMKIIWG